MNLNVHPSWPTVSNSKYSTMIGCLRTRVRKKPIIALYFEFKNELKFYNLEATDVSLVNSQKILISPRMWAK